MRVRLRASAGTGIFTPAELETLQLLCQGLRTKEIAARRKCSAHTVHRHTDNLDRKIAETMSREAWHWNGVKRFIWAVEHGYVEAPQEGGQYLQS